MSIELKVHPLVVMSIADHYTREKVQKGCDRVIGAVFGIQTGRRVDVLEAFEIAWQLGEGDNENTPPDAPPDGPKATKNITITAEAFENDMRLFKEAYAKYEFLGWYSTGSAPHDNDMHFHQLMTKYNERPVYLQMNPNSPEDSRDLPLTVYIEGVQVSEGHTQAQLLRVDYEIEADESERVTAVYCANVAGDRNEGETAVVQPYNTLLKANTILHTRLDVIREYLSRVRNGQLALDHTILRNIKGMCDMLPVNKSTDFQEHMLVEVNDAMLITYLATIHKNTSMTQDLLTKFESVYDMEEKSARGGGGYSGKRRHYRKHTNIKM